jgi:hypothetical protein
MTRQHYDFGTLDQDRGCFWVYLASSDASLTFRFYFFSCAMSGALHSLHEDFFFPGYMRSLARVLYRHAYPNFKRKA